MDYKLQAARDRWLAARPDRAAWLGVPCDTTTWPSGKDLGRGEAAAAFGELCFPTESATDAESLRLQWQVQREQREAQSPLTPFDICDCIEDNLLGCILAPLAAAELRCALNARLRDLPDFVSQLPLPTAEDGWQCEPASTRLAELSLSLRQVFRRWQQQYKKLVSPLEAAFEKALQTLDELARGWRAQEHSGSEPIGPEASSKAWQSYCDTELDIDAVIKKLEQEIQRTVAELEKRCTTLHQRYDKKVPGGGESVHFVLQQIATDQPRPEYWLECHRNIMSELERTLLPRELPFPVEGEISLGLGSRASRRDTYCHGPLNGPASLQIFDLATLPAADRQAHLDDHNSYALTLLLAREGVPGRLSLLQERRATKDLSACLLRESDLEAWAQEAPELLARLGWMQGEARIRILLLRDRLRDLLAALADLEYHTLRRPEIELFRRLRREGMLGANLVTSIFSGIRRTPLRRVGTINNWLVLREELRKYKRRTGSASGPLDIWLAARRCCDLPPAMMRTALSVEEALGLQAHEVPPPVVQLAARKDELIQSVESQLAALGRIRSEDLDAGSEFDGPAPAVADDGDTQSESTGEKTADQILPAADLAANHEQTLSEVDTEADGFSAEEGAAPSTT